LAKPTWMDGIEKRSALNKSFLIWLFCWNLAASQFASLSFFSSSLFTYLQVSVVFSSPLSIKNDAQCCYMSEAETIYIIALDTRRTVGSLPQDIHSMHNYYVLSHRNLLFLCFLLFLFLLSLSLGSLFTAKVSIMKGKMWVTMNEQLSCEKKQIYFRFKKVLVFVDNFIRRYGKLKLVMDHLLSNCQFLYEINCNSLTRSLIHLSLYCCSSFWVMRMEYLQSFIQRLNWLQIIFRNWSFLAQAEALERMIKKFNNQIEMKLQKFSFAIPSNWVQRFLFNDLHHGFSSEKFQKIFFFAWVEVLLIRMKRVGLNYLRKEKLL
jgi:hypothetical protein